jgi:replication factor C subunit 2/4
MIMTEYSSTTRFAIACNDSSKIIEPIQSRCAIVRFTKLSDEEVVERLQVVIENENISCTPDGMEALVFTAEGDMRYALNNLQATHAGFPIVNKENVFKVCD